MKNLITRVPNYTHIYFPYSSPCETLSVAGQWQGKPSLRLVGILGLPVTVTGNFCQILLYIQWCGRLSISMLLKAHDWHVMDVQLWFISCRHLPDNCIHVFCFKILTSELNIFQARQCPAQTQAPPPPPPPQATAAVILTLNQS